MCQGVGGKCISRAPRERSGRICHGHPAPPSRDETTESQNHRMFGVGRDLCGSSSPAPLPKHGHLEQAAQDRMFYSPLPTGTFTWEKSETVILCP